MRHSGLEGYNKGGLQKRRVSVLEGYRKGGTSIPNCRGIQERRDSGMEGFRTGVIPYRKGGFRT